MSDPAAELRLMQSIHAKWNDLIVEATKLSSIPPAFVGALIANESGGDPTVSRFEPKVYDRLKAKHPEWDDTRAVLNASSLGLTQIMGVNYPGPPQELRDPATNLFFAVKMLAGFAERFQLDLRSEFEQLLRCWNAGTPHGTTTDSLYVQHGIERMKIWQEITSPESAHQ
jgi:soluble lytic murein transglycosylase-like protein